ncbi:MAG: VIT1/CCC1 transporter family protein [Alphaproteobacteria bacterium]
MGQQEDAAHTLERWSEEKASEWLYHEVAAAESDPAKATMFRGLAKAAEEQAAILAGDIGGRVPVFHPTPRLKLIAWLARTLSPERAKPLLAAVKVRGLSVYGAGIGPGHPMPVSAGEVGGRHRRMSGGTLRAGVFGVNDGVVSNTCLILGVAGAAAEPRTIVLTGIAGLLAGAFSMAAGEYVSMASQRELFEYQIGQEREELERYPAEEAEELALIYNARGVPMPEARAFSKRLIGNKEEALDTLAREELGLNPEDLGSPWGAAGWSFVSFALGALVPLAPFFAKMSNSVEMAAVFAAIVLVAVGAMLSLFSGRSALWGGLRMFLIGALAGAASYGIGGLLGVGLS